ncbi:jg23848, partial [Pararge aegeria aegeria]
EYRIGLKFNEQHIPDSPFKVYISPAVGDAHLLEVAQFPDNAQVDKPTQFYIRLNGAKGSLDGRVSVIYVLESPFRISITLRIDDTHLFEVV